jgi:hypothetical protein
MLYIVTAYRYGDTERHSYPVGVYSTVGGAIGAATDEEYSRGGKYSCHIVEAELDRGRSARFGPCLHSWREFLGMSKQYPNIAM